MAQISYEDFKIKNDYLKTNKIGFKTHISQVKGDFVYLQSGKIMTVDELVIIVSTQKGYVTNPHLLRKALPDKAKVDAIDTIRQVSARYVTGIIDSYIQQGTINISPSYRDRFIKNFVNEACKTDSLYDISPESDEFQSTLDEIFDDMAHKL